MTILVLIVIFAIGTSFVCSILESALLSVSMGSLVANKENGSKGSGLLLEIKQTRVEDAISAILTLNTVANTIGASLAGAEAAIIFGDKWVGLFSGLLTLAILIFSEIIPKTLGTVYAVRLSGAVGRTLHLLIKFSVPLLALTRIITRLVAPEPRANITKGEIAAMIVLASNQGILSPEQSKVLSNLLSFEELTLVDVMTPRSVIAMLPAESTVADMMRSEKVREFTRIPLYGENFDDVKGYVLVREIWAEAARGGNITQPLSRFLRKMKFLPKSYQLGSALRHLVNEKEHLAMVLDEFGGISGLVTLEDLIETILGVEITDELDRVEDMRQKAIEIRDQRLERIAAEAPISQDED